MNSIKYKTGTASKTKRRKTSHINPLQQGHVIKKKINGTVSNKIQNALLKEFLLLKDISGFSNESLASLLDTTQRTIQNKKTSGKPFSISQTERLRKLTRLFKEGNEIFGNKEQFNEWLQKASYSLDYNIPSELLKQPGGLDEIMNELNSIKFGDAI